MGGPGKGGKGNGDVNENRQVPTRENTDTNSDQVTPMLR